MTGDGQPPGPPPSWSEIFPEEPAAPPPPAAPVPPAQLSWTAEEGQDEDAVSWEAEPSAPAASWRPAGAPRTSRGRRPAGRRPRRHWGRWVLALLGVIVLAVVGVGIWYYVEAHPSGQPGPPVEVVITPGESESAVMDQLAKDGVIGSALAFRLGTIFHGTPSVVPGRYSLATNESFAGIRTALGAGPNVTTVKVLPGQTISEVAGSLAVMGQPFAKQFLDDAQTGVVSSPFQPTAGATLEGVIGTGAYQILPDETPEQLLTAMVARFSKEAAKAGLTATTAAANGLTEYQVVVLASIDLKEGYFDRYLGPVARVIYNRLAKGMTLSMTSTVLYSFGQDGGPVTQKEEQTTTPYNTYLHKGLTPTPICTPSEKALAAAVHPPAGTWLYFDLTTVQKGIMVFSTTFTGQLAAEAQAAANAAAASGPHATTTQAP